MSFARGLYKLRANSSLIICTRSARSESQHCWRNHPWSHRLLDRPHLIICFIRERQQSASYGRLTGGGAAESGLSKVTEEIRGDTVIEFEGGIQGCVNYC